MRQNNAFFLYQLHIFNLPIALFLRLFGAVRVFKYVGFCQRFLGSKMFQQVSDFESIDQWRDIQTKSYSTLRATFPSLPILDIPFEGRKVNCSINFSQRLFIEFEQYLFFHTLCSNSAEKQKIINYPFSKYLKKNHRSLYIDSNISSIWSLIFTPFNILMEIKTLFFIYLKSLSLIFKIQNEERIESRPNLVLGLSLAELSYSEDHSDFTWLIKNKIFSSSEINYVFQSNIPEKAREFNKQRNVNLFSEASVFSSIPFTEKISIFFSLSTSFLSSLLFCDFKSLYKFKTKTVFCFWNRIIERLKPKNVLYSLAQGWPELHIVPLLKSKDIKTINWFYGAGEFAYKTIDENFNDHNLRFCLREADQTLVWNNLTKMLLEDRQWIETENQVHVYGPVMNGKWEGLDLKNESKDFTIAIFDSESMKPQARLQRGHGPFYELSTQNGFYDGIKALLINFPNIKFHIKGKKPINSNPLYYDVKSLELLKTKFGDRIVFEELKTDPLSLIAKANLVISSPFTSPGLASIALGVPSVYYDSTKLAISTYNNAFKAITLNTPEELIEAVNSVMNGSFRYSEEVFENFGRTSPVEMNAKLRELL